MNLRSPYAVWCEELGETEADARVIKAFSMRDAVTTDAAASYDVESWEGPIEWCVQAPGLPMFKFMVTPDVRPVAFVVEEVP
jgi:hypothetical protein